MSAPDTRRPDPLLPSPCLTPYIRKGGTPWLRPSGRVSQDTRRRPSKDSLLIYTGHLAELVPSFTIPLPSNLTHHISFTMAEMGRGLPVYIHAWEGEPSGEDYWATCTCLNKYVYNMRFATQPYIYTGLQWDPPLLLLTRCERKTVVPHPHQPTEKITFWLCAAGKTRTNRWRGEEQTGQERRGK